MFDVENSRAQSTYTEIDPAEQRVSELRKLRRQLFLALSAYATVAGVACLGTGYVLLRQFIAWRNALPQDALPSLEGLLNDRPEILATSLVGGVIGLAIAAVGMYSFYKLLGPKNHPPRKIAIGLTAFPLVFSAFGMVMTLGHGVLAALLILPFVFGYTLAMGPLQLFLLSCGLLNIALRQLRQSPEPIEATDLPAHVAEYFAEQDVAALEAGLTPVGDFVAAPDWDRYYRYWMAPNGAYFVEATWAVAGNTVISVVGVISATSDGRYFETVDHAHMGTLPELEVDDPLAHLEYLPDEPLETLIERHVELVADWVATHDCRPLEFSADECHALSRYGVVAHLREYRLDILWLANPYYGQPLPPLPGRSWHGEDSEANQLAAIC